MSSKPAQSISLESVASRRNVIRSAAWTTAAVTVVVATPNIAAASTGNAAEVTYDSSTTYAAQTVTWTITIKNTGTTALNLTGTFGITNAALDGAPAGLTVTSVTSLGTTTWGGTADNSVRTYSLAKGLTATVTVKFKRSSNSKTSGTVSASFVSGNPQTNLGSGTAPWARP